LNIFVVKSDLKLFMGCEKRENIQKKLFDNKNQKCFAMHENMKFPSKNDPPKTVHILTQPVVFRQN